MASYHAVTGSATPTPAQLHTQAGHGYTTPQHQILSTSTPMQPHRLPITTTLSTLSAVTSATPLPTPPLTAEFASDFSLPLASSTTAPYSDFTFSDGLDYLDDLDDVFGTAAADVDFGLDMDVDMDMGLARLTDDTLPLFRPSTPMKPFTPSTAYPALPASTGGRVASVGMSSLNLSTGNDGCGNDGTADDDLFGGRGILLSGDAAMSSPAVSRTGTAVHEPSSVSASQDSHTYTYPDPVSYASMPPVSAAAIPTPFTLPVPTYVPLKPSYGNVDSAAETPVRRRGLRHQKSMPNLRSPSQHANTNNTANNTANNMIDPNDWRARLRYCEQAPNKALLEASMVRLLEFSDTMDERELAERRAANLRFDKIREQRLKDRNNEAAKRSRQRKVARIEAAEQQIASLRRERAQLVSEVASLRRRLASGSSAPPPPGESTGVRRLRPTRSMAAKAGSRMGDTAEDVSHVDSF